MAPGPLLAASVAGPPHPVRRARAVIPVTERHTTPATTAALTTTRCAPTSTHVGVLWIGHTFLVPTTLLSVLPSVHKATFRVPVTLSSFTLPTMEW
jgi:hypothetical protein